MMTIFTNLVACLVIFTCGALGNPWRSSGNQVNQPCQQQSNRGFGCSVFMNKLMTSAVMIPTMMQVPQVLMIPDQDQAQGINILENMCNQE